MFIECRHILPSGQKCNSPALRGHPFCYFHSNLRERAHAPKPSEDTPFVLPSIEDSRGLLLAVSEVFRAMGQGRIKQREASTYLYGLQIAAKLVSRIEQTEYKPVRALVAGSNSSELGEERTACEPLHDCVNCDRQDICEAHQAAKNRKPENIREIIARVQSMTPGQAWAEFQARQKARAERMRRLQQQAELEEKEEASEEPSPSGIDIHAAAALDSESAHPVQFPSAPPPSPHPPAATPVPCGSGIGSLARRQGAPASLGNLRPPHAFPLYPGNLPGAGSCPKPQPHSNLPPTLAISVIYPNPIDASRLE